MPGDHVNAMNWQVTPPEITRASNVSAPAMLAPLHETTTCLPPTHQFESWAASNALLDFTAPAEPAAAGFAVAATSWRFGRFVLMTSTTPAARYCRAPMRIRRDGIDHWAIAVATAGQRIMRAGDTVCLQRPGSFVVTSMDQPAETLRAQSAWTYLFMPRDLFPGMGAAIDAARMMPIDSPLGRMLHDYLLMLPARMPAMRAEDAPRLADATRAMVAAALAPHADHAAAAEASAGGVLVARMRALIRANLGQATLGPDRLCAMLGTSRSQLYRHCEPFGGVAAIIQAERLRAAQRALCDASDRRPLTQIAMAVGIFDASSFTRLVRRHFGCSPTELRRAALAGQIAAPVPVERRADAAGTLLALLQGTSA